MELPTPITREEKYFSYLSGNSTYYPEPVTRLEQYLYYLCENGAAGGGGSGYVLPRATAEKLGGVKATAATAKDTVPVHIKTDGTLAVETYPEGGTGGAEQEKRIQMSAEDTTVTLDYNKTYVFPEMDNLEITMSEPQEGIANVCTVWFTSGSTPTHLVLNGIRGDIIIESLTVYRLTIEDGYASLNDWSAVDA